MFIKEVSLSHNGWYIQLLHYIFPRIPIYDNFCPIFWLTVLALILSPFVFLFKSIWKILKFVGHIISIPIEKAGKYLDIIIDNFEKRATEKAEQEALYLLKTVDKEELEKAYFAWKNKGWVNYYLESECKTEILYKLWMKINDGWRQRFSEEISKERQKIVDKYDQNKWEEYFRNQRKQREAEDLAREQRKLEREKIRKERAEKHKIFYAKLITLSKYISVIIAIIVGLFVAYHLFFFLGWLLYWISYFFVDYCNWSVIWENTIDVLEIIIMIILYLGATIAIGHGLAKIFHKINYFSMPIWLHKALCNFGTRFMKYSRKFANLVVIVFEKIGKIIEFFIMGLKTFKSDNCPHVNWKD